MSGTHLTIDLFAVAAIVALPFLVLGLARWAARGPAGRSVTVDQWLVPAVAFVSGAAGLIHLLVIEEHLRESVVFALLFTLLAAFQMTWAVWFGARPGRLLGWVAVPVSLVAVAFWVVSRTVGLPDWLGGGEIEPVGLADLASTVFELLVVAGILAMLWRPIRTRVAEGRALSRADAGLGMAMVVLGASLLTLGAIGEIAAGSHVHAAGDAHDMGTHVPG